MKRIVCCSWFWIAALLPALSWKPAQPCSETLHALLILVVIAAQLGAHRARVVRRGSAGGLLCAVAGQVLLARALSWFSFLNVEDVSNMRCGNEIDGRIGDLILTGWLPNDVNIEPSSAGLKAYVVLYMLFLVANIAALSFVLWLSDAPDRRGLAARLAVYSLPALLLAQLPAEIGLALALSGSACLQMIALAGLKREGRLRPSGADQPCPRIPDI